MDYGPGSKAIENSLSRDVNGSASSNIDSTAELIRHHPVLQALIKLEVSNSLLRLQLGDDATECLQERLDTVLSDNTCLVQRMAEIERQNHASRSRRDTADSIGDKDGRDSLDGKAGDSVVSQLSAMIKRSSFTSKSRSASEDGGAKGSANNVAPSAVAQSPAPRSTVNHQSGVGSRIVAIGNSSGEQSAAEITATYVTPPRRLLSGASGPLGGVGVAEITRPSESSATSSSHGDRAVKSVEISPEANDHLNFVEVCEIGMDRKILTGAVAATTSLQNAQVVNVFPPRANTNSDGHFDTIIPNITDFCFPNGVPVDIVSASAAEYITGPPYDSYHVIQFVDPNVGVIYGCCIIISEMVKPMNKTVEDNLVDLKRRKRAADIICCRLKHYIRYREHLRWTKPSIVLVGNYHNNGGIAHRSVPGRRVSDSNIDCKQDGSFSSPNANIGGNVPDTQERKTMLSRLTKWGRKDTPSSSAKGRPADPATPSGFTDINGGAPLTTGTNVFTISEHESASTSPNATHQDRLAADSSSPAVEASNATKTPGTVKKRFSWFSSNTAALASTSTKPENVKSSKDYMAGTESPPPYGANLSTPDISTRSPSESIGTADGDDQDDGFVAEGGTPLANHDEFSDSEHGETQLSSSRAALQSMYNLDVYKSGKSKRSNDNSLDAGSDHSHNDEVRPVVYKRKKKGGGAGKMIVTKKAFCVLSHTPCHAFMFKVLQKIIDTESLAHDASKHNSKLVRTMSPYGDVLSGAGEGTVSEAIDRAGILRGRCQSAGAADDITGVLNDILSDVKVYDVSNSKDGHASSPVTVDSHHANVANNHANPESSVITEAIMRMQLKNRNDFLSVAQKYDLSVIGQHVDKGRLTAASPNVGQTSSGTAANEEQYPPYCTLDCRNYFLEPLKIYKTQSTFREWACGILFATINHTVIIKIMNLLLLEKSVLVYGTDVGLVSAISSGLMEIVTPFQWEGVFVPVMPYIAKEVLQAPVPFIIGSNMLPKMEDLSPNAAIIFLDNKLGCRDIPIEECAWFMSIPEVDANMPVSDGLSKLLKRASQKLSRYLPLHKERQANDAMSDHTFFGSSENKPVNSSSKVIKVSEISIKTPSHSSTPKCGDGNDSGALNGEDCCLALSKEDVIVRFEKSDRKSQADLCKQFLYNLDESDKNFISKVMDAITRHNMAFCGDAVQPGGWIRYCKYSKSSGYDEFYPQWFMQPRRATTEFQEALVHTQLFVSYLDRLRDVFEQKTWQREFIANWLYFKYRWRKVREARAAEVNSEK